MVVLATLWVQRPSLSEGQSSAWRWSATVAALLLSTPHLNSHDLALLLLPCALILRTYERNTPIPLAAALVGLSVLPFLTATLWTMTQVHWPVMPVALIALFLVCLWQSSGGRSYKAAGLPWEPHKNNLINSCGAGLWPAPNTAGEDACTTK